MPTLGLRPWVHDCGDPYHSIRIRIYYNIYTWLAHASAAILSNVSKQILAVHELLPSSQQTSRRCERGDNNMWRTVCGGTWLHAATPMFYRYFRHYAGVHFRLPAAGESGSAPLADCRIALNHNTREATELAYPSTMCIAYMASCIWPLACSY